MAQKDKVKELVGRGLNSYHTKALQQMDRIEKKNKEQNHKISILSNELDNDYLTKTEEGSVISLEYSKEGMVYLDELQGNTLVNYCTDGSKEMTLNGDIDVEGTFVTTTEGVDNGKVDIMCEGNTLVNLIQVDTSEYKTVGLPVNSLQLGSANLFQNGKQYTIICEFADIVGNGSVCFNFNSGGSAPDIYVKPTQGLVKYTFTMPTNPIIQSNAKVRVYYFDQGNSCNIKNLMILEGDWTNKEVPSYFVGMKSVGECEGNKIEILSQNKNLFDSNNITQNKYITGQLQSGYGSYGDSAYTDISDYMPVKQGKTYVFSYEYETLSNVSGRAYCYYDNNKNIIIPKTDTIYDVSKKSTIYTPQQNGYIRIAYDKSCTNIQFEQSDVKTSYSSYAINKKEILLNEPLRGLPNGVKDRFVKIGGKLYIERNIKKKVFDGTENWEIDQDTNRPNTLRCDLRNFMTDSKKIASDKIYCDKFISIFNNSDDIEHIRNSTPDHYATIVLFISKSKLTTIDADGVKEWFSKNNTTLLYQLETPIYEPLEIEPTLNTYTDIAHISNNSIIPCNMKIQNSGYNAIIKPSTLYTVALDTNKSGTVGINLGGVKVTTTNNVTTITTPATLADDSLRLYGKGIKGSKVRLLEGDKTNWIPSFFEGMKSSFEDKLQDDGSYKMEILSNNQNLVKELKAYSGNNAHSYVVEGNTVTLTSLKEHQGYFYTGFNFGGKLKPNTTYYISSNIIKSNPNTQPCIRMYDTKKAKDYAFLKQTGSVRFTTPSTEVDNIKMLLYSSMDNVSINNGDTIIYENIQISEVDANYVEPKFNKIQFSSIEPLRKWDRFVFKDNKLMIERNSIERIMNHTIQYGKYNVEDNGYFSIVANFEDIENSIGQYTCENNKLQSHSKYADLYYGKAQGVFCGNRNVQDGSVVIGLPNRIATSINDAKLWLQNNPITVVYKSKEPTYEEVPFELQKIILEGYENGTLFFDTNIPPTSTVTYAGETPIVKVTKLNKTEVLNNTNDINDNIIPYLMDMDYRVVCLQLQSENINDGVSVARLFGGAYEMLQRDIQSKRYSIDEYRHRLDAYLDANKITEEEYNKLGDMLNE